MDIEKINDPRIGGEPGQNGFGVSEHILDNVILEKVAHRAWQKELVQKFQKPYVCKWASNQSVHMFHFRADDQQDDHLVTPRGHDKQDLLESIEEPEKREEIENRFREVAKYDHYKINPQTICH